MRRNDREIKDFDQIIRVIEKCDVLRLALNDEDYPYILPLNFGILLDDGQITLYFHGSTEGKKHELIAGNNKASFEMDCSHRLVVQDGMCTMEYESVIGRGTLEKVDEADKSEAMSIIMKHYHEEDMEFNKDILPLVTIYKMTVTHLTGKARMCSR